MRSLRTNQANREVRLRLVGVSSSVCGFDGVKAFVVFPYEGGDDQPEQDDRRHHDEQLKQRVHAGGVTSLGLRLEGIRQSSDCFWSLLLKSKR